MDFRHLIADDKHTFLVYTNSETKNCNKLLNIFSDCDEKFIGLVYQSYNKKKNI